MAIIGLFQCDPWFLPTQNCLKNATNDISIHEFHNVTRHYVKDTDCKSTLLHKHLTILLVISPKLRPIYSLYSLLAQQMRQLTILIY